MSAEIATSPTHSGLASGTGGSTAALLLSNQNPVKPKDPGLRKRPASPGSD